MTHVDWRRSVLRLFVSARGERQGRDGKAKNKDGLHDMDNMGLSYRGLHDHTVVAMRSALVPYHLAVSLPTKI